MIRVHTCPGESVDDCGGGYSESIAEMCDELQNGSLPLLIPTPNGRDDSGTNRDCFLLNPLANSRLHASMFQFLGILMGIAIRTGSPLSLNLAEPVWKQLAGVALTPADLMEVDRAYVPGLLCIRDMDPQEKVFQTLEMPFSTPSAVGHEVPLSTRYALPFLFLAHITSTLCIYSASAASPTQSNATRSDCAPNRIDDIFLSLHIRIYTYIYIYMNIR
jgi:hypothetical protein